MKSVFKKLNKKVILSGAIGALLLFLATVQYAHATGGGLMSMALDAIGSAVVGNLCYVIGYIISAVLGIVVAIESWLLSVTLNLNASVLQTTLVQNGFSISLAIANMAFVLGIIVIAIATILRRESYGIKQLLWKLVVMAVLVNFGLVIMAPIFGIGNSFTQYFINCISPTAGGCSGSGSGGSSYNNFATTFAGAFHPQNSFLSLSTLNSNSSPTVTSTYNSGGAADGAFSIGSSITSLAVPILGVAFLVINMGLIVCVLGVLIIMMIIRYIYIAILAILLPFAWAAYVFPSFSSHFEAWWKKFLQWTFFSPVVMFFIYLAIQAMSGTGDKAMQVTTYTGTSDSIWGAISNLLTGAFAPVIQAFLQETLLVGLIFGGLIAANAMSIKFAGTAVGVAQKGAKAAGAWTGRQGIRGARAGWQKAGGQKLTSALSENKGILSKTGMIGKIPVAGWLARRGASLAGRGMASIQTNEHYVEEAKKGVPKSKDEWKENIQGNMNEQDMLAHIAVGTEKGWLKAGTKVNGRAVEDILDDEALIKRNGQGNLKKDADVLLMSNTNVRNAERAANSGQTTARVADDIKDESGNIMRDSHGNEMKKGAVMDTEELRQVAMEEFTRDFKTKDAAKVDANGAFGPDVKPETLNLRLKAVVQNPQLIGTILKDMKSPALKNFERHYTDVVDEEIRVHTTQLNTLRTTAGGVPTREQAERIKELSQTITGLGMTKVNIPKLLINARYGYRPGRTTPAAPPPPGPTP